MDRAGMQQLLEIVRIPRLRTQNCWTRAKGWQKTDRTVNCVPEYGRRVRDRAWKTCQMAFKEDLPEIGSTWRNAK